MAESSSTGNGIGFGTLLFVVFLVLKLCNVISWSWWWVTAPLWIPAAFVFLISAVFLVIFLTASVRK